jgi:excisionase family DNA binding protein
MNTSEVSPAAFGLTRAAYSVREASHVLSLSVDKLYDLIRAKEFKPVKVGSKTLIFAEDITKFLAKLREPA